MTRELAVRRRGGATPVLLSRLLPAARARCLGAARALADAPRAGLRLHARDRAHRRAGPGRHGAGHGRRSGSTAYALWHSASLAAERTSDELRVLKLAARDAAAFDAVLGAIEASAAHAGLRRVAIRCQSRFDHAFRHAHRPRLPGSLDRPAHAPGRISPSVPSPRAGACCSRTGRYDRGSRDLRRDLPPDRGPASSLHPSESARREPRRGGGDGRRGCPHAATGVRRDRPRCHRLSPRPHADRRIPRGGEVLRVGRRVGGAPGRHAGAPAGGRRGGRRTALRAVRQRHRLPRRHAGAARRARCRWASGRCPICSASRWARTSARSCPSPATRRTCWWASGAGRASAGSSSTCCRSARAGWCSPMSSCAVRSGRSSRARFPGPQPGTPWRSTGRS